MSHNFEAYASQKLSLQPLNGNTFYINTGLLGITAYKANEHDLILLDCGMGYSDCDAIIDLVDSLGMRVSSIIASHCHVDHIGSSERLKEKYGCKIYMPSLESDACRYYEVLKSNFPYMSIDMVKKYFKTMHCQPDYEYPPEDLTLTVDGAEFKIIFTPGHSLANVCIITPDNVMHMGDTVIGRAEMAHNRLVYTFSIGMDIETKEKIRGIKCVKYVAVHNGVYDDIDSLLDENIAYLRKTAEMIYDLITEPMSVENLIESFYDTYGLGGRNMITCALIERSIRPYIEYLWDEGRLDCICEKGIVKYIHKN